MQGQGRPAVFVKTLCILWKEQHLPSDVINRDSMRDWKKAGSLDTFSRAKVMVNDLLASYTRPELDSAKVEQLHTFMLDLCKKAGVEELPILEDLQFT